MDDCELCYGIGQIEYDETYYDWQTHQWYRYWEECWRCNGTGEQGVI